MNKKRTYRFSKEGRKKRIAAMKARQQDPVFAEKQAEAARAGLKRLRLNPEFIKKQAAAHFARRRVTDKKKAEIIKALQENPNATQVSKRFDVSNVTIGKIAKEAGIELKGNSITEEKAEEVRQALIKNPNARGVARQLDVNRRTVTRIAKDNDIELQKIRPRRPLRTPPSLGAAYAYAEKPVFV
jgi:transposase-like protein